MAAKNPIIRGNIMVIFWGAGYQLIEKIIETPLDHAESKLSWIQVLDREDARVLATLEHCRHAAVPHAKGTPRKDPLRTAFITDHGSDILLDGRGGLGPAQFTDGGADLVTHLPKVIE